LDLKSGLYENKDKEPNAKVDLMLFNLPKEGIRRGGGELTSIPLGRVGRAQKETSTNANLEGNRKGRLLCDAQKGEEKFKVYLKKEGFVSEEKRDGSEPMENYTSIR